MTETNSNSSSDSNDSNDSSSSSINSSFIYDSSILHRLLLPSWTPLYKFLNASGQIFTSLDSQIEFHDAEELNLDNCVEWIEETTLFLAGWVSRNM
jgi:hypothetical protein